MGNALFSLGSRIIDLFGYGYKKTSNTNLANESDDDDDIDRNERIIINVEEMESYCKPLLFVKFFGQTSSDQVSSAF